MNAWTQAVFSMTAPCLPCPPVPASCECALLIPPFASPWADYATAASNIADPLVVADCLAYFDSSTPNLSSFTASFDGTTLALDGTFSATTGGWGYLWVTVAAKSGATLTFTFTDADVLDAVIYDCDGATVETLGPSGSPITSAALAADGVYYIKMLPNDPPPFGSGFTACSVDITSSDTFTALSVIAQWDDSGTTRSLWACPKLLLPPLTESTGDWYADATAAATAITDLTNSCKGYIESTTNVSAFSASGTTSLTLAETLTAGATNCPSVWGGINAEGAATITSTITVGAGTAGQTVTIYDDAGAVVETSGVTTSPWTSSALPYTGRYTVKVAMTSSSNTTSMSAVISSSGTMSINPPQARYDTGLVCAATDDC